MSMTMAQALAERIRYQINSGEKVLAAAGEDHHGAVFGNPEDVLNVRGNVADVAHTNHLWLLDAVAAGAVQGDLAEELKRTRPSNVGEAVEFLGPRESDSGDQALAQLRRVNERLATLVEKLSDQELDAEVDMTFYGPKTLRDLLFVVIEHGALHIGQAWGILKGHGVAG